MTTTERDDEAIPSIISSSTESSPLVRLSLSEIFREISQVMALEGRVGSPITNLRLESVHTLRLANSNGSQAKFGGFLRVVLGCLLERETLAHGSHDMQGSLLVVSHLQTFNIEGATISAKFV
jgi:hypothetical protein